MLHTDVAEGVHLVTHAHVNCYLIEDDTGVTLVDAGLPSMWSMVNEALAHLGRNPSDVHALVLTHGHFDHVGFARQAQRRWSLPVLVHRDDAWLAAHPYRYRPERNRLLYPLTHPGGVPLLARMAAAGALWVKGVDGVSDLATDVVLDLPGQPVALPTPGHTMGHCALHLPQRDVVLCGDAVVTLDPYTGRTGPQIVASAATADSPEALASLQVIADTGATTLLPGHGDPWHKGAAEAVEAATKMGAH